jgi:hypothetical protein
MNAIKLAAVAQLILIIALWVMWLSWTASCDARLDQQMQTFLQSFDAQTQHIQDQLKALR